MENNEKTMHYANFNITFGENNEPMLLHFEDIILPTFLSGYKRINFINGEEVYPKFSFSDVKIKCINEQFVLVGNYIKETEYSILSQMQMGKLKKVNSQVPAAPYSRFIIFLDNHKMILVRNETGSPDVRSFQKTFKYFINRFIREYNNCNESKRLPYPIVNIVNMPKTEDISVIFSDVKKINKVKLGFYPLNNDDYHYALFDKMAELRKGIGSNTGNINFNSPSSKSGVAELMSNTNGIVKATVYVETVNGTKEKITNDSIMSSAKVTINGDLTEERDDYLAKVAKKNNMISRISEANEIIYNKTKSVLERLKNKYSN